MLGWLLANPVFSSRIPSISLRDEPVWLLSHASDRKILSELYVPKDSSPMAVFSKRVLSQLHLKTILSGFYLLLQLVLKLPL